MENLDPQVIFLILFVVIGAVKWVIEKIKGTPEPHDVSETLEEMYEDFREEIRQRQTEAQQPSTPPPLPPQVLPTPPRQTEYTPSITPSSARLENYRAQQAELSTEEKTALQRFQSTSNTKRKRNAATSSVRAMLSSPGSARKAVILREILGEPRSLQKI